MTLAQLTSAIDQAAACGVESVYFEGGEPTLAYPIVLAAAKHARERGLEWGMVSNCFWATSVEDAKVWLAPFADLGISDLSLSSYAYFVEDADESHLRNAALAAQELGLPMGVLEVGAAACLDVPGLCLGEDVGEIMCKGRAAVELAPGRAARPPETLVTCPFEDFADPGRAHLGLRRRAAALPGHQRGQRVRRRGWRRGRVGRRGRCRQRRPRAHRRPGRGARALRSGHATGDPRDHRRRPLGLGAGVPARAAARALRRRVPPLLRSALRPSRALSPRPCAGPVLRPHGRSGGRPGQQTNQRRRDHHAVGVRTVLGAGHVCHRGSPDQQEALPEDHLRGAQGAGQDRLPHRPGQRRGGRRQGVPGLRVTAQARRGRDPRGAEGGHRRVGRPRPPTPASRTSGSTR